MVVSRSFRRILTRNARDGCFICSLRLFCRFVLQGLTTFMCRPTQSSVRLLPSEVNWSLRIAANPFFSSIWWMQNILSFAGRLRRSPHQFSPVITCTNGVNLDTRILDKVFAQSLTLTCYSVITTVHFITFLGSMYRNEFLSFRYPSIFSWKF